MKAETKKILSKVLAASIALWTIWAMSYIKFDPLFGTIILVVCMVAIGALELDSVAFIEFSDDDDCEE